MRKAVIVAKHPRRTTHDVEKIQELSSSLESHQVNEEVVYETIRKPSRRGIAPGSYGYQFEFLQSITFNPYECVPAASVLHLLIKFINLEKDRLLPDQWYDYNTYSILVALGAYMRPLDMDFTGRKLVSAATLAQKHGDDSEGAGPFST